MYCDCQSVIDVFHTVETAVASNQSCPQVEHFDIWSQIFQLVRSRPHGAIRLCKIKAHADLGGLHDPFAKWCHTGNDFADKIAKASVRKHPSFKHFSKGYTAKKSMESLVKGFFTCICDMTKET